MTRAASLPDFVSGRDELAATARALLEAELPLAKPIRLMGLTLGNLEGAVESKTPGDRTQLSLF